MPKMSCGVLLACVVFTMTLIDTNCAITMSMKEIKAPVTKCFDQTLPYMDMVTGVYKSLHSFVLKLHCSMLIIILSMQKHESIRQNHQVDAEVRRL